MSWEAWAKILRQERVPFLFPIITNPYTSLPFPVFFCGNFGKSVLFETWNPIKTYILANRVLIIGLKRDSRLNIFEKYWSISDIWNIWHKFFCYFSKGGTDFSEKLNLLNARADCSLYSVIYPSVQQLSCPRKLNSYSQSFRPPK